jgi:DNA-binding GntR family transcriptional regulator
MPDLQDSLPLDHRTMLETVVSRLRKFILTGHLRPGERLIQDDLAERFGISRTPIREALRELASEGLVTISPYKGASVARLVPEELEAVYHVRIALESYAARLAVRNLTDDEMKRLEVSLDAMRQAFAQHQLDQLVKVNQEFYLQLFRATRQPRLYDLIANYRDLSSHYRRLFMHQEQLSAGIIAHHEALFKAIEQRDEDRTELLVRSGLEETVAGLTSLLKVTEPEAP